jgi:hypothetical protein
MYTGALADLNLATSPWNNNRYAFAGGNPITGIELDGHRPLGQCDGPCSPNNPGQQINPITGQVTGTQWTPDDDRLSTDGGDDPEENWPTTEFELWLWHQSKELDYESSWVRTHFDTFLWEQINAPDTPKPDETGNVLLDHGYVQVTWCAIGCVSLSTQGGHLQLQLGGLGVGGLGIAGGANTATVEEQKWIQYTVCGSFGLGACAQTGASTNSNDDPWVGGGLAGGVGFQVGPMVTVLDASESGLKSFGWEFWSW